MPVLISLLQGSERLTVGITAHEVGHITVRVVGAKSTVQRRAAQVRRVLKSGFTRTGCPASVVSALFKRNLTITTVESCTF